MEVVADPDRGVALAVGGDVGVVTAISRKNVSLGVDNTSTPGFPTAWVVCSGRTEVV